MEQGAEVYAYDPVGKENFNRVFQEGKNRQGYIKFVDDIEEALKGANVCFIITEWVEVKAIKPSDFKRLMRTALVYDVRNLYNLQDMQVAEVE